MHTGQQFSRAQITSHGKADGDNILRRNIHMSIYFEYCIQRLADRFAGFDTRIFKLYIGQLYLVGQYRFFIFRGRLFLGGTGCCKQHGQYINVNSVHFSFIYRLSIQFLYGSCLIVPGHPAWPVGYPLRYSSALSIRDS